MKSLRPYLPVGGRRRLLLAGAVAVLAVIVAGAAWRTARPAPPPLAQAAATAGAAPSPVVARAHIEPRNRVHLVSGPSTGGTVADIRIVEGDYVRAGDLLATLDTYEREANAVVAVEREVQLAQRQLDQAAAGAKQSEVAAQAALAGARSAELDRTQQQLARSRELLAQNFISADALEQHLLEHRRAQQLLQQSQSGLKALTETRPVDVRVAQALVDHSKARLRQARAQLALSEVRAPINGTVLAVYGRKGESIGRAGLASIGDLDQLMALAEINEQDAPRVAEGQPATIVLRGQAGSFRGRVAKVMRQVAQNSDPTTDVLRGRDARVAEVEVAFEPGQSVPRFVGMEATVTVNTGGPATP